MSQQLRRILLLAGVFLAYSSTVFASQPIPSAYRTIAQEYGIPATLFYALALTESGQSSLSQQKYRPWPWTLNINGRGQYFSSRAAAWRALQTALAEESTSVDVGLLQIAWRYHQSALGSAWHALDPYHNLRVGAAILKACYVALSDWPKSLGCYHAPNDPKKAKKYRHRVQRRWQALEADSLMEMIQ